MTQFIRSRKAEDRNSSTIDYGLCCIPFCTIGLPLRTICICCFVCKISRAYISVISTCGFYGTAVSIECFTFFNSDGSSPSPRSGHSLTFCASRLWVAGGADEKGPFLLKDLWSLDVSSWLWEPHTDFTGECPASANHVGTYAFLDEKC